ncbi:hypothetical protein [Reyranella sp.]|uniref:hypothetical protein n=1 Tax=Reyranella sp. TaxID=1929291 RepID=UPI003F72846D
MRNVFDQYSQPENRITHALMTALHEDRELLGSFLREIAIAKPPVATTHLAVLVQQLPETPSVSEEEAERRGIPDGWIYSVEQEWCLVIESKVLMRLDANQIDRHRRMAERLGFTCIFVLAITVEDAARQRVESGQRLRILEWSEVYVWLRSQSSSEWARRTAEYMEVVESRMIMDQQFVRGALTRFSGVSFSDEHPYTYLEAKRILRLLINELRGRRDLRDGLGVDPNAPGRGSITGSKGQIVWDFLSLRGDLGKGVTTRPHLSLGIGAQRLGVMVTIPDKVEGRVRGALREIGEDAFAGLLRRVVKDLKPLMRSEPGAIPTLHAQQRRWRHRRAKTDMDAELRFDLRTIPGATGDPKKQPLWLSAAYGAFVDKRGSNYEFQVGVEFDYARCSGLQKSSAVDLIARAWLGCKPFIDLVR